MARRPVPPPKPKAPILTAGQKQRRLERLEKCIANLEAFDSTKVRKRFGNPEVLALEAAVDKGLSSAFGYGTPAYMRFNQAATLDPGPLISNVTLRSPALRPVGGGPARHDAQADEARQYFSEGRDRSISLLREAIAMLEREIAAAQPVAKAAPQPTVAQKSEEVRPVQSRPDGGIGLKAAWQRVRQWWRRRRN
jgi:hypothetical protein